MPALLKIIQNQNSTVFDNKKIPQDIDTGNVITSRSSAVQRIVIRIEKKIRNLEKRKNKLKQAECDLKAGKTLIEDQKKAVQQLNHVETQIDFAREILRNVIQIASADETVTDNGSLYDCFDDRENCKGSNDDIQQLLTIQNVLHCLGEDAVRSKFRSGVEGALKLTNEQLAFLDETYHKLTPVRYSFMDRNDWNWSVAESAKFIRSLLGFSRSICFRNTTFNDLRTLLDEIVACPYFDRRIRSTGSSDSGASVSTLLSPGNVADESSESQQSPKNDIGTDDLEELNHSDANTADIFNAGVRDLNIGDDAADHVDVSSHVSNLLPVPTAMLPQIFYAPAPGLISMAENTAIIKNTGHVVPQVIAASLPTSFALPQVPLAQLSPIYAIEQPLQMLPVTRMSFVGSDMQHGDGLIYENGIIEPNDPNWVDNSGNIVEYGSAYETTYYEENSETIIFELPLETTKPLNPDAPEFVPHFVTSVQVKETSTDHSDFTNKVCESTFSN